MFVVCPSYVVFEVVNAIDFGLYVLILWLSYIPIGRQKTSTKIFSFFQFLVHTREKK